MAIALQAPAAGEAGTGGADRDARDIHPGRAPGAEASKKDAWRADKATRRDRHLGDKELRRGLAESVRPGRAPDPAMKRMPRPGARCAPTTTLHNAWTREALPMFPGRLAGREFSDFLRDHFTNQATDMDPRLADLLGEVARRFRAPRIEVVSGYRSPKYNLMLRKKGHEVARSSQHVEGTAVDFRVRGVRTPELLRFVRGLRRGGVGYYPKSQFVHGDFGPLRYWQGS